MKKKELCAEKHCCTERYQLPWTSPRRERRDLRVDENTYRVVRCRSSAKSPSPIIDMLLNRKSLPGKTTAIRIWCWTGQELALLMKRMCQGGDDLWHVQQAARAGQTSTCSLNDPKCGWRRFWFLVIVKHVPFLCPVMYILGLNPSYWKGFKPYFPIWTAFIRWVSECSQVNEWM